MKWIQNAQGEIIGYTHVDGVGRLTIFSKEGRLLGWYDPKSDWTCDMSGRLVGRGNQLMLLLANDLNQ